MADYTNIGVASEDLDELIEVLKADIKTGGFHNDDVIWMIKVWTKVTILAGLNNDLRGYWIMKRPPTKVAGKRSQLLVRTLEDYSNMLEKSANDPTLRSGDSYHWARDAMLNFVWDYRQHLSSSQEMDFVHQLQVFTALSTDQLMQEAITKMDQSL
jgi:hypothetical protein